MAIGKWFGGLCLLCALFGCDNGPDLSQAKNYEVLRVRDIDTVDRTRKDAIIYSAEAKTPEECAQTAMKAAYELRNKYTVYVMRVFVEKDKEHIGVGNISARAIWSPDGEGFSGIEKKEWEVDTMDDRGEHPYTPKQK